MIGDLTKHYNINNIVGRANFYAKNKINISGNALYSSLVDLEKDSLESKLISNNFINHHDFSEDKNLFALAIDGPLN